MGVLDLGIMAFSWLDSAVIQRKIGLLKHITDELLLLIFNRISAVRQFCIATSCHALSLVFTQLSSRKHRCISHL